ncbi:MAG: M42 family peptidase [Oscillospiraceae bacterium]|nr:M42 family peptidase [Oscillospiraceae bacterium]
MQWLGELCALPGISGREGPVRDWLIAHLPEGAGCCVDPLGSLIVNPGSPRSPQAPWGGVMLCAHMDEVGMVVTHVTEEGLLKFAHVGGIERAAYLGRQVAVGRQGLPGVIGLAPVHLLEGDEKTRYPKQESLYIDIGAQDREDASRHVRLGDYVTFAPGLTRFGDGCIASKALDDRLGCQILLELLRAHPDMCAVFSAREEIGGAAGAAAFALAPRYAIVIETTTAADLPGIEGAQRVCSLGGGAVAPFMDRGTMYPLGLYELAMETAERHGIPAQTKTVVAGATDAAGIHRARGGVPTLGLATPCRNLHSPALVAKESDAQAVYALAELLWEELRTRD